MSYQTTDIHGVTTLMPDHSRMVEIVDEMYAEDRDVFSDVILSHRSGYSISLHPNGCAALDRPGEEEFDTLHGLSKEEQLMLWLQLAAGNLKGILQFDWKPSGADAEKGN